MDFVEEKLIEIIRDHEVSFEVAKEARRILESLRIDFPEPMPHSPVYQLLQQKVMEMISE